MLVLLGVNKLSKEKKIKWGLSLYEKGVDR